MTASIFSEGQVARAGLSQAGKVNAQGRDVFQGQLKAALNPEGGFVTSSAAPSKGQGPYAGSPMSGQCRNGAG